MAQVIQEAKALLNSTPMADYSLYRRRLDHLLFLQRLDSGKL
jgi:hypothetical protein